MFNALKRMITFKKTGGFHPALPLVIGLISAQIIATIHVWTSNLNLYASATLILRSGYLSVPNEIIIPTLKGLWPAICGGLFFSLSIGAGISLLCIAAAWMWDRLHNRSMLVFIFFLFVWAALLFFANANGFNVFVTLYFIVIPILVGGTTTLFLSRHHRPSARHLFIHVAPVIVLAMTWFAQVDRLFFLDVRDCLLFSNPVGKKITEFYYTYTLYAAETFTSLNQKLVKTYRLEKITDAALTHAINKNLTLYDYVPVEENSAVDLKIIQINDHLLIADRYGGLRRIGVSDFLSKTENFLHQFATQTDRFSVFRRMTFIAFLIGYPLALYLLLHALMLSVTRLFVDSRAAAATASLVCFMLSIGILVTFFLSRPPNLNAGEIVKALKTTSWRARVGALRSIERNKMAIDQFEDASKIAASPHIAVRYWLAKALAYSRSPESYTLLNALTNDCNPNVVCMAYASLATRRDTQVIAQILHRLKTSDNWYSQLYAYKALRALGWKQSRLP